MLHALCRRLIEDKEVVGEGVWSKLVMVGNVAAGGASMCGFCFDANGDWQAAAPRGGDALDLLRALREAMASADAAGKVGEWLVEDRCRWPRER